MVIINVDVLSRYLFNAPIQGVAEIVELSIVGIVFLQISDAVRAGRLTRSDGLYMQILKRRPMVGGSWAWYSIWRAPPSSSSFFWAPCPG